MSKFAVGEKIMCVRRLEKRTALPGNMLKYGPRSSRIRICPGIPVLGAKALVCERALRPVGFYRVMRIRLEFVSAFNQRSWRWEIE